MFVGKHLIIDITDITEDFDLLEKVETIKPLMELIIQKGKLNVVGEIKHQFYPIGCTLLYLLSESHLSIHTYPELWKCSIDLYTCNVLIDFTEILDVIYSFFDGKCRIYKKIIER